MDDDKFVVRITEKETMEFLTEGLRQSAGAAKQLSGLQSHPIWEDIATLMDEIHNHVIHLARSKPLTRQNVLSMLDVREKRTSAQLDEKRPVKKFII